MVYKVRDEGIIVRLIFFIYMFSLVILNIVGVYIDVLYLFIATLCLFLISYISEFDLSVGGSFLEVQRAMFKKSFYKKRIAPEQIKEIKFILVGWKRKGAIIKLNQGFSLPITKYAPDTVIEELMEFADKNVIPVKKTKDFMVLEKWNM